MSSKSHLVSFQNASLLRKMTILYFLISIIPMGVLYYLFMQMHEYGRIMISREEFEKTLIFVVCGIGVGFFALRQMVLNIINITQKNRQALEQLLGKDRMLQVIDSDNMNEVTILTQSFNEITSRLEENVRNLELAKKTLHSVLSRVGEGIASMDDIDSFLKLIVETVTDALQTRVGLLMVEDDTTGDMMIKSIFGKNISPRKIQVSSLEAFFADVIQTRQSAVIHSVPEDNGLQALFDPPILCAPLVLHDEVLGLIAVSSRMVDAGFETEEINLLTNLALQTAVAVENARLNDDAERTYFETISALALAVEAKDIYSRGHLDRVARYVVMIGKSLNLSQKELNILRDAARLHDLGKIGVMDEVLKKEGPLTAQEMEMMKRHCEIGESIIKPIRSLRDLCDLVRHHHEKLDGSGYPDRLRGDSIHMLVRILTVADIYDALTTNRPYRRSFTREQAFEEMRDMKDKLDQHILDVFENSFQS